MFPFSIGHYFLQFLCNRHGIIQADTRLISFHENAGVFGLESSCLFPASLFAFYSCSTDGWLLASS